MTRLATTVRFTLRVVGFGAMVPGVIRADARVAVAVHGVWCNLDASWGYGESVDSPAAFVGAGASAPDGVDLGRRRRGGFVEHLAEAPFLHLGLNLLEARLKDFFSKISNEFQGNDHEHSVELFL